MTVSKTVIISCAGMGKRLGLGTSKCLVDVAGESLIMRNLKMLDDVDRFEIKGSELTFFDDDKSLAVFKAVEKEPAKK